MPNKKINLVNHSIQKNSELVEHKNLCLIKLMELFLITYTKKDSQEICDS